MGFNIRLVFHSQEEMFLETTYLQFILLVIRILDNCYLMDNNKANNIKGKSVNHFNINISAIYLVF